MPRINPINPAARELADAMIALRKAMGLKRPEFAALLHISRDLLINRERGHTLWKPLEISVARFHIEARFRGCRALLDALPAKCSPLP